MTAAGQHIGSKRRPDGHGCPSYSEHGLFACVQFAVSGRPCAHFEVPKGIVEDGPDDKVSGSVVAASLRDCGPCPDQDATTIHCAAKPVSLPVKVGAALKTMLAERGGYTHSATPPHFFPLLATNFVNHRGYTISLRPLPFFWATTPASVRRTDPPMGRSRHAENYAEGNCEGPAAYSV